MAAYGFSRIEIPTGYPQELDLSADLQTAAVDCRTYARMSVQLSWEGLDAYNARAILQGSSDGVSWCDLGGSYGGIIILDSPESQLWEITSVGWRYIRLDYTANSNTTGTGILLILGYSRG